MSKEERITNNGSMTHRETLFDQFRIIDANYVNSMATTNLFYLIVQTYLENFPSNLPEKRLNLFEKDRKEMVKQYSLITKKEEETKEFLEESKLHHIPVPNQSKYFSTWLAVVAARIELGRNIMDGWFDIDFMEVLNIQLLVMLLANLEAFLVESVNILCQLKPELVNGRKKSDLTEEKGYGNQDNLGSKMLEKFINDFGRKPIRKKLVFFREKLEMKDSFSNKQLKLIYEAQMIRNLVIHNGGKINLNFIKNSERKDLKNGVYFKISDHYLKEIKETILKIIDHIRSFFYSEFTSLSIKNMREN